MKVLVDNCIPLNNGDAELIFSLGNRLKGQNFEVIYNTMFFEDAKILYPNENWEKNYLDNKLNRAIWNYLPGIRKLYVLLYIFFKNSYFSVDTVVSAPGGYIHSYYGIELRMYILYICKKLLKKKVGIYSQSIGDLSKEDQKYLVKYGKVLDFIIVRDQISFERIQSYGLVDNVILSKDAALLSENINQKSFNTKTKKVVAISVRGWKEEGRKVENYYQLIIFIITVLVEMGYKITFISTCQGIPNYTDDSKIAEEIVSKLEEKYRKNITIDHNFYNLFDFQKRLRNFDYVIGTRLHMCLISLLNKVPAINISYEEKGKEAYDYLKLSNYTIDYNELDLNLVLNKMNHFFERADWESTWELISKYQIDQLKIFEEVFDTEIDSSAY